MAIVRQHCCCVTFERKPQLKTKIKVETTISKTSKQQCK